MMPPCRFRKQNTPQMSLCHEARALIRPGHSVPGRLAVQPPDVHDKTGVFSIHFVCYTLYMIVCVPRTDLSRGGSDLPAGRALDAPDHLSGQRIVTGSACTNCWPRCTSMA